MTLFWLYIEQQPEQKISNHAYYTFWYVLPTLPMFLVFPIVYEKWGFLGDITSCIILTIVLFGVLAWVLRFWDIDLL